MDSLTQATLGAAVGAAFFGRTHGRKAVLIGAVLGTLPDMDVVIPYGDPVSNFTYHRGFSHSLFCHALITPLIVWLISKMKWLDISWKSIRAHMGVFIILATHALLDAMTIYGTQLFWPLPAPPVGIGSIFIIDPLYTLPLLFSVILFIGLKSQKTVRIGLIISTAYLGWSVFAQSYNKDIVMAQVDTPLEKILVQPTALNTILWRIVVMEDGLYRVGYYSLFDDTKDIEFTDYPSDNAMLPDNWAVARLQWFTKGFYGVREEDGDIIISDLRMGAEPDGYVFQFIVNKNPNETYDGDTNVGRLKGLWDRMFRDL